MEMESRHEILFMLRICADLCYWRWIVMKLAKCTKLLQELKLYCQSNYEYFIFSEGTSYTVPESWGECQLRLTGEANAEFELIQYRE